MYFMRNNHFFRKNLFVRFDFHCTHIWVIVNKSSPKKPVGRLWVNCRPTHRRRKGYSCQCITHFGCLWSENREKTFKFVTTFHQQATDRLPTSYQHITNCHPTVGRQVAYISGKICWPSVGQQSADCQSTDGRQLTDSRPTGFLGRASSQLPRT